MKKVYLILIGVFVLSACGARREVADVWNYIMEKPDSALMVLSLLNSSKYRGRTLAEYHLLKAMAMDKNYIDVSSDSLARPALDYFRKHGPKEKEMLSMYYLGMSQYYANDLNQAITTLGQVAEKFAASDDKRYIALSNIHLSHIYYAARNYTDAIATAKTGILFFSSLPDSSFQTKWAAIHLSDCYVAASQYNNASELLFPLIQKDVQDTLFQQQALIKYSWCSFLNNSDNVTNSISYFEKAIRLYGAHPTLFQLHHYGRMLLAAGKLQEAEKVLETLAHSEGSGMLEIELRYRLLKSENKFKEALECYELLLDKQNEEAIRTMSQSLSRVQRDYQSFARSKAEMDLKWERNQQALMGIVFLMLFILIFIGVFYWWRKTVKSKNLLLSSIEEANKLLNLNKIESSILESELEDVRRKYVVAYKKQFQKIASLVEYYYTTSGRKDSRDLVYKQVMEFSATVGKDRESMRALERNVNASLGNAMKWYREDFPGRSQEHYDLVCYFMAGFPASLVELLTGIPRNTLYSKKRRLLDELSISDAPHRELLYRVIK